jgi:RHS repeat-associated protein
MGYSAADSTKQKFTQKERDNESGLDYFLARYYSSAQGRFTSADPLLASGRIEGPQTWNRYAYAINNPLSYIDPTGMFIWDATLGGTADDKDVSDKIRKKRQEIRAAITKANEALNSDKLNSTQKANLERALKAYGAEGMDNGVKVAVGQVSPGAAAETSSPKPYVLYDQSTGDTKANVLVTFKEGGTVNAQDFAHEGSHVADRQEVVAAFQRAFSNSNPFADWLYLPENITVRQTESKAFRVTAAVSQGLGAPSYSPGGYEIWNSGWREADRSANMQRGIKKLLTESPTYRDKLNKRLISER